MAYFVSTHILRIMLFRETKGIETTYVGFVLARIVIIVAYTIYSYFFLFQVRTVRLHLKDPLGCPVKKSIPLKILPFSSAIKFGWSLKWTKALL